jgi:hypothetical protein
MANVYVQGKRIVPAPFYGISHEINRTAGGVILSCVYNVTLTGTILANRGYPSSTGAFSTGTAYDLDLIESSINTEQSSFKSLVNKQAALKELVLLEGASYGDSRTVQIINTTGGSNGQTDDKIEFNYLAANIEFEPSNTTNSSNYTITFTANDVRLNGRSINPASGAYQDYNLRSASDTFNIAWQPDRDATVNVTRAVRAQGYKSFDNEIQSNISASSGWQFAKEWVKSQFPANPKNPPTTAMNGVSLFSLPDGYGYVGATVSEDIDKLAGDYGMSITWIYAPLNAGGAYYAADEYTITKSDSIVGNKTNYKISGSIRGTKSNTKADAYEAASAYFSEKITPTGLKSRIATNFGISTSVIVGPLNSVETFNNFAGTINYEYDFFKKIATLPACFFDVDLTMSQNVDERVIAEVPVPGRTSGPVIQDIKTKQTIKRNVNANFTLSQSGSSFTLMSGYKASGLTFLGNLGAIPGGSNNTDYWQTSFSHSLDIIGGRYSMNIGYVEK